VASEEPRIPVRRVAGGRYRLRLEPAERRLIGSLVGELKAATEDGTDLADPAYARLYPVARPDDPGAQAEFASLVREDLEDGRRRALETVTRTLDAETLDGPEVAAWLGVCNDLRLVIGTRLRVGDQESGDQGSGDADRWPTLVFNFLGWLVGELVDALAAGLPDVAGEAPA